MKQKYNKTIVSAAFAVVIVCVILIIFFRPFNMISATKKIESVTSVSSKIVSKANIPFFRNLEANLDMENDFTINEDEKSVFIEMHVDTEIDSQYTTNAYTYIDKVNKEYLLSTDNKTFEKGETTGEFSLIKILQSLLINSKNITFERIGEEYELKFTSSIDTNFLSFFLGFQFTSNENFDSLVKFTFLKDRQMKKCVIEINETLEVSDFMLKDIVIEITFENVNATNVKIPEH